MNLPPLVVGDFFGEHPAASDEEELTTILARRDANGANAVSLSTRAANAPLLAVVVRAELAYAWFHPGDDSAGFNSCGDRRADDPDGTATFATSASGETIEMVDAALIPTALALLAAREFALTRAMPESLSWTEL